MYEDMVKEAYEEIIGFEKEAKPDAKTIDIYRDGAKKKNTRALIEAKLDRDNIRYERAKTLADMKRAKNDNGRSSEEYKNLQAKNEDLKDKRNLAIIRELNPATHVKALGEGLATGVKGTFSSPSRVAGNLLWGSLGSGAAFDAAAGRRLGKADIIAERAAKRQAEKAAAYYEEAQLVKEAAEADYAEACAYEDAALAILDELGYLD